MVANSDAMEWFGSHIYEIVFYCDIHPIIVYLSKEIDVVDLEGNVD